MKSMLSSLFLSLYLATLSTTLHADNKTVTEANTAEPISINKGDTLTFSLDNTSWRFIALASVFKDPTTLVNDPKAAILSWTAMNTTNTPTESSTSILFNATNSGQIVLLFTRTGADSVYQYENAATFIVNIKDPAIPN